MTNSTPKRSSHRAKPATAAVVAQARRGRKPKVAADGGAEPNATSPRKSGKLDTLTDLMSRKEGATIADMMAATGWQAHSVRGAIAGALKRKRNLTIASEAAEGGRIYRIGAA